MSFLPHITNQTVGILIEPERLTIALVSPEARIQKYSYYIFENNEINDLIIFNTTKIKTFITNFLVQHNCRSAQIICALDSDQIYQTITPEYPIHLKEELSHYAWDCYKLNHNCWYTAGISQELLCHYKIFGLSGPFNIMGITTKTLAHYEACMLLFPNTVDSFALSLEDLKNSLTPLNSAQIIQGLGKIAYTQ